MPAFTHLNNGCDCQSCQHRKKDAPQLPKRTKGFSPGAAAHASQAVRSAGSTANGIAFAVLLGKSWQAIDASDPSGLAAAGHCRLNSDRNDNARSLTRRVGVGGDFAAFPVFPAEVVAVPPTPTHYRWGSPAALPGPSGRAAGQTGTVSAVRDGIRMNDA
jgi:hypothetical protein